MSSQSYLCCGLGRKIYPSDQEGDYTIAEQTVAVAAYRVPLLWLCLFRPEDMVEQEVTFDLGSGETITQLTRAPVVERRLIKDRLKDAVPRLESAFPKCGSLRGYATKLREAIDSVHKAYPFVTIEYQEVAALNGKEEWDALMLRVLEFLSGQDIPDARQRLLDAADLEDIRRFVPVKRYLEDDDLDDDDWIILDALLGSELERPVPWQPQAVIQEPLPIPELLIAIKDGQLEQFEQLLQSGTDPNTTDPNTQKTALERAITPWMGRTELPAAQLRMVELLIAAGARVSDEALACAARLLPLELFQAMFAAHPSPNACDTLGEPAVHHACESQLSALAKARLLLDAGADVNRRTPTHYSALRGVFALRNFELAKLLFERGLDSHAADEVLVVLNYQISRRGTGLEPWLELLKSHRTKLTD